MERFIREIRRSTKVRDHKFPTTEAVFKGLYLESERPEGKWTLSGFAEAKELLEQMLKERYSLHRRLHVNLDTTATHNKKRCVKHSEIQKKQRI